MTETIVRAPLIQAPDPTPLRGTLLDAATVVEGIGWLEPTGLFESYNCMAVDSKTVWPCPPAQIANIVQSASATATTGGTLPAGTYRAVVTAINDRGETAKSNEVSQVTTGAASTVTFNWPDAAGETGYRVYLTNGVAGSEAIYVPVAAGATSLAITAWPPAAAVAGTPPAANTATVSVTKTFSAPGWADGIRFSVYGGVICKGFDQSDQDAKLRKVFEARESIGVERALMQTRFTTPAATDLTPAGGAVDPVVGVGMLEGDAACKYAGVPTLHVPRVIASLLSRYDTVEMVGNVLTTLLGSKVAAGGGYGCPNNGPTGAAPAAGEQWLYASGEVVVARSELIVVGDINRTTNEQVTLVERTYVAAVDCYTAAVRVKVA